MVLKNQDAVQNTLKKRNFFMDYKSISNVASKFLGKDIKSVYSDTSASILAGT